MKKLAILGAGSWGLTLAWLACDHRKEVCLWDRSAKRIAQMQQERHVRFPVSVILPSELQLTHHLADAIEGADIILLAVSVSGTREVLQRLNQEGLLKPNVVLVNASKGIEFPSLKLLSEVFAEECPDNPYAVLSGPTLAMELLNGLPTACAVACKDASIAEMLQQALSHELFRVYSNTDVIGVELGGALKNVFAIASGYMQTKELGDNALAALLTRGLHEMTRFSVALGAEPQTLYGMSGLGDMLATANSPLSRNYQVGARLAQGEALPAILTNLKVVAEGVKTTEAVCKLSEKMGLEMPVAGMVKMCLDGPFSEKMIVKSLMNRKLRSE